MNWIKQRLLGGLALITIVLFGSFVAAGCSQSQKTQVAQAIVNYAPAFTSAEATIASTVSLLDPAAAPILTIATSGFDAAQTLVVAQAKAYLANPTAGILTALQTGVTTLQQTVNSALLQAAGIKDPESQARALAAINAFATIVNVVLGLIQSISNQAQLHTMSQQSTIKLAAVKPYMNERLMDVEAHSYGITSHQFFGWEAANGF